jgi:hypothetical protein
MSAIATTNSSASDNLLALLHATQVSGTTDTAPSSGTTSGENLGPATVVTLSDQAKAAAAEATSDQAAADRLQAYVEAHRVNVSGTGAKTTSSVDSLQSIFEANTQAAETPPTDTQAATSGAKVEAIVAQIKTLADANEPPPFQPFTPTKSLSNSVTADGYTLSLNTNAGTQFYGVELSGSGFQRYTDHFGPSDGASVGSGSLPPGVEISSGIPNNNNEAEEAYTVTQNIATASSASISSSSGRSTSTSSVNAESSSITFLVNYATGKISVAESAMSVSAQAARASAPGSTLSTLA